MRRWLLYLQFMFDQETLPIRRLDRSRPHDFKYAPDASALRQMVKRNQWKKARDVAISGRIEPQEKGWELTAQITGTITMTCVISGAPLHIPVDFSIRRLYLEHVAPPPQDFSWDHEFDVDAESLPQSLSLNALLSESLLLELPEYPKLPKYRDSEAYSYLETSGHDQNEEKRQKPFADLKTMLEEKDQGKS